MKKDILRIEKFDVGVFLVAVAVTEMSILQYKLGILFNNIFG